jgi:hypothetical protein
VRGLTIRQPYADLIALGIKTVETRSWAPAYRGPLLIHAARKPPSAKSAPYGDLHAIRRALQDAGSDIGAAPVGAVVAVARLVDVLEGPAAVALRPADEPYGSFAAGRYGWILADVCPLADPIECRGALGLWRVDHELAARLAAVRHEWAARIAEGDGLALRFAEEFSLRVWLPSDAVRARSAGTLNEEGWLVHWVWGTRGRQEYLEYYATHRMVGDVHVRLWADGHEERLEAMSTMFLVDPADPEGSARRNRENNRRIARELADRGLLPGLTINQHLGLFESPDA